MKHQYVSKTTDRFIVWRAEQRKKIVEGDCRFRDILLWLQSEEDYAVPLNAVVDLVRDLRSRNDVKSVSLICLLLINEYRDYQAFIGKVSKAWRFIQSLPLELGFASSNTKDGKSEATTHG